MTILDGYPGLKALHVAAAFLFVGGVVAETAFLAACGQTEELTSTQTRMAMAVHELDRRFTTPAMLLVWAFGLTLAFSAGWFHAGWLQLKLVFVLILSALHGFQSGALRRLAAGSIRSQQQAAPAAAILICTLAIALLAVIKPF